MGLVVAIDAGTTGVRALAVDETGRIVGRAYTEFPQYFPRPGWVEHDADEIWSAVTSVLTELAGQLTEPVAAIGITDQRETVVTWDARTGRPRARAIVWQDRRGADRCEQLDAAGLLPIVRSTTGLVLDPYFSATKIEWLLTAGGVAADPDLRIGTIDSWLIWKLTGGGVHATDPSNASRTMLYDIGRLRWSGELLDCFGVPEQALPEVRPSSGSFGATGDDLPVPAGIPITGVAGDQQAALFGQACFEIGMAKITYGTGSFVLANIGSTVPAPVDGLLTTVAWQLGSATPVYALEGAVFVTGAAIQWLRDGLGMIDDASEVGPLASSVSDTGGVVFVPAFTGLGSPWWDPRARGLIIGITRGTSRAHVARAVVESIAMQCRDVVEAMIAASGRPLVELRADGGASVMDLLLQLQADHVGVRVTRSAESETTALGAAYLAGLGAGVWSSPDEVAKRWSAASRFEPVADRSIVDAAHRQWRRAVERSLLWSVEDA